MKKGLAPKIRDLMGSRDFKTYLLYYHIFVITYRSKIIPPYGFIYKHIIFKVLDNVFLGANWTEDLLVALQRDRV